MLGVSGHFSPLIMELPRVQGNCESEYEIWGTVTYARNNFQADYQVRPHCWIDEVWGQNFLFFLIFEMFNLLITPGGSKHRQVYSLVVKRISFSAQKHLLLRPHFDVVFFFLACFL